MCEAGGDVAAMNVEVLKCGGGQLDGRVERGTLQSNRRVSSKRGKMCGGEIRG